MAGFVEGLASLKLSPDFPIVIRRDGPRQKEAFAMLLEAGKKKGYDFHLYGPETSMAESAVKVVKALRKKS
jgi:succinyl-CoA synthetase beta subunit